ncbi:MAG: DUF1294 domain-containing protein [Clostridia bacterium]|nr:DUF1294 domain-containing protein [Clostridia bacterium]
MKWLILAVLLWNLCVFCMMGIDKRKAKRGGRRIAERTLLLSALAFGSLGGFLGMELFHHKTLHNRFRYGLPAMFVLHLALIAIVWFYLH